MASVSVSQARDRAASRSRVLRGASNADNLTHLKLGMSRKDPQIMASLFDRLSSIIKPKENQVLDKDADPGDALDRAYQRQLDLLQRVRRGAAEVADSRKSLDRRLNELATEMDRLTAVAKRSLAQGREDLAREALIRKAGLQAQLGELESDRARLWAEEEKLVLTSTRLQAKADTFRARVEALRATQVADDVRARLEESSASISRELGDVGETVRDAEQTAQQTSQRASALGDLISPGAPPAPGTADAAPASPASTQIDAELAALRAELAQAADAEHPEYRQPGSESSPGVQDAPVIEPPAASGPGQAE